MTEEKFLMKMLCCMPKECLLQRLSGSSENVPEWLKFIPTETVVSALNAYEKDEYKEEREMMLQYL